MLDCQGPLAQLPTEYAPSPRTVARSQCSRLSADRLQPLPRLDECREHHVIPAPRRNQPISHHSTEVPFCEACRQQDADLQSTAELKSPSPIGLPSSDDDDASRSWIFKQLPGPWWWCEDCQASVTSPKITIPHLFAVLRQWTPYAQLQLLTIVEEIFRRGAHVDDRDGLTDMTLLHFAAKSGAVGDEESSFRVAEFLLDAGACLEARCKWTDMTPLHYAAYFDCPMLVELFLRRGAQLEARSRLMDNATPLHFAASQLSLGAARVLLHASAHSLAQSCSRFEGKDAVDALGRTPYDCIPPVAQLAEPLCSLRDRVAELLGPPVKNSDASSASATERIDMLANTTKTCLSRHSSPTRRYFGESDSLDGESSVASMDDDQSRNALKGISAEIPPTQSDGAVNWLVAESGFLSPRNRRSIAALPSASSPTPTKSLTPRGSRQTVNHPLPPTSSVSAKVTLQSLGLALNDVVCIGQGASTLNGSTTSAAISSRIGRLRYCGPVDFASGIWVGVELEQPLGRNNGSVSGVQYFSCAPSHGLFAPIGRVYKAVTEGSSQMWHPVQSKRPPSVSKSRPTTPKQERRGSSTISGDGDVSPKCFVPSSRSSYSLSSSLDSGQPRVTSPANQSIDLSHVTAKVDTGLRTHYTGENSAPQLEIGNRVLVAGQRKGIIRFIGSTQFAPGIWYGVELDQPLGKNNGSVSGVRYFQCPIGHGIFASRDRIQRLPDRPNKVRGSPSTLSRHPLMSESFHQDESEHRTTLNRPNHRMAWSTTTSPMVGQAVIGRPPLPTELLKVFQNAANRREHVSRTSEEPAFYIAEGMQVLCAGEIGIIRYIGPITFADGVWLGVELRKPRGRHDGSVAGKRYFHCRPGHGLLVRPSRVSCRGISAVNLLPPAMAAIEHHLAASRQIQTEKLPPSNATASEVSSFTASSSSSRRSSCKHSPM